MIFTFRALQLFLAGLLLTSACNFRDDKETAEDDEPTNPIEDTQLNFAEVETKVLAPYCQSCHSTAAGSLGGINLETYEQVKSRLDAVQRTALVQKRMPPGSPLKGSPAELLQMWIDKGAPETTAP